MAIDPASTRTNSASLAHLASIWYDRVAVENLKPNLAFVRATTRRKLPSASGKTIQLFGYSLFPVDTTPATEGTPGPGITPTTVVRQATVQQYADYVSFSDLLLETAIDPIAENVAAELGFRAANVADRLTRSEFETAAAVTGSRIDLAAGSFLNAATVRRAVASLQAQNVQPMNDNMFVGLAHPLALFDLTNDNTAGGVIDILKYTSGNAEKLQAGFLDEMRVVEVAGVRFISTTEVGSTPDFPGVGKTGFHTYIVGKDAIFTVSLGETEIPEERNFRLTVRNWGETKSDPAGLIGATVAYNFKFAALRNVHSEVRLRQIRAESSIA